MTNEFTIAPLVWEKLGGGWHAKGTKHYEVVPTNINNHNVWRAFGIGLFDALGQAQTTCDEDNETRLKQCLVPVVKVECENCVHHREPYTSAIGFSFGHSCKKFTLGCRYARYDGPCDGGRGGKRK